MVLEMVGHNTETISAAADLCRPGGTVVAFGIPDLQVHRTILCSQAVVCDLRTTLIGIKIVNRRVRANPALQVYEDFRFLTYFRKNITLVNIRLTARTSHCASR